MLKKNLISCVSIVFFTMGGTLYAKEYTNTSFYVAYDGADSTQYALVMPSVNKIYTHKAGHILPEDLKQVDKQFENFPTYNNGKLCFSMLVNGASEIHGASKMAGKCYDVNFFYTQKEVAPSGGMAFILTYTPLDKAYEGLAGDASSFLLVRDNNTTHNENSVTNDDYTNFTFNTNTAKVTMLAGATPETIYIHNDYEVHSLGKGAAISKKIQVDTTAKSLYILLTNYSKTTSDTVTIRHNAKSSTIENSVRLSKTSIMNKKHNILPTPTHIQNFQYTIRDRLIPNNSKETVAFKSLSVERRNKDIAGNSTQIFYFDTGTVSSTQATARKVVSNIATGKGTKTLNIWVSDDSFDGGSGCSKVKCTTQAMVDVLAESFLKAGADNDIYDWITNIFGEEWGGSTNAKYRNIIAENNEITILLTDIGNDNNTNGGTLGYFYAKDNFTKNTFSGSNERIMFYIDSVLFATEDNDKTWNIDNYWPKIMISTLAHEFQHMIHFYQKGIVKDVDTEAWVNEMLSETAEDAIATKLHHDGARGVVYTDGSAGNTHNTAGRYPLFNANNTLSLTAWNNSLEDYSKVNSFGAFLTRNYGGVKILHDILYNSFADESSVVYAVNKTDQGEEKTFNDILKEWGIAVLLSDNDNLQDMPTYNTGDFTIDTYENSTYELGSINFFNYNPLPTIHGSDGTVSPQGNYYYKIGNNITGSIDINITLSETTEATLIAK